MIKEIITSEGKFSKNTNLLRVTPKTTTIPIYKVTRDYPSKKIVVEKSFEHSNYVASDVIRYSDNICGQITPNAGEYAGQTFYYLYYGNSNDYTSFYVVNSKDFTLGGVIRALYKRILSHFLRLEVAA